MRGHIESLVFQALRYKCPFFRQRREPAGLSGLKRKNVPFLHRDSHTIRGYLEDQGRPKQHAGFPHATPSLVRSGAFHRSADWIWQILLERASTARGPDAV